MYKLFTIGHSTHTTEKFIELLSIHAISAVCDVRSNPYSKFNPHFNRETIKEKLKAHQISYLYLGKELGPRSDNSANYIHGRVQYNLIATTELFQQGLKRLRNGLKTHRVALMCAEKDPIMCHRTILICRNLRSDEIEINHILENGGLENNKDSERRLMKILKIPEATLFDKPEELIERAYDIQGEKIAHTLPENSN